MLLCRSSRARFDRCRRGDLSCRRRSDWDDRSVDYPGVGDGTMRNTRKIWREREIKGERRNERRLEELKRVKLVCSNENGTVVSE